MKRFRGFLAPVGLAVVLLLCRPDTARAQGNTILVGPTSLSFTWQTGAAGPASQVVYVTSATEGLPFTVSASTTSGGNWLALGAGGGTTPFQLFVGANPTGLGVGTYSGTIQITAAGAANSPVSVPVSLTVTASSQLVLSPTSLSFYFQTGGSAPAPQTVSVSSSGSPLSFSASASTSSGGSWLLVSPGSGNTPGALSVSVNPSGLAAGTYNGTVTLTAAGATPGSVPVSVTLTVSNSPQLTASPASLTFYFQTGGSPPPQQGLSLSSGTTALSFSVSTPTTSGGNWLVAAPSTGVTPASLNIFVNPAGLGVGTYTGTVTITGAGATNSPLAVAVTLVVTNSPLLTVSPASLSFNLQVGGTNPANQTLTVTSTVSPLSYTVSAASSGGSWLAVGPVIGTTPGTVSVAVNPTGLPPGSYSGSITVTAAAGNTPQTVGVTLTISNNPLLSAYPGSVSFGFQIGTSLPASQVVSISSTGSPLGITVAPSTTSGGNWLSVTASGATTPVTLTVSVNPAGLTAGAYNGSVTVTAAGAANSPLTVNVTLVVSTSALLVTSPPAITFSAAVGATSALFQTVALTSTDNSPVAFSITSSTSSGGGWLLVGPTFGSTPSNMSVTVNPAGLAAGVYNGSIVVTAPTASNSPQTVAVRLVITSGVTIGVTPASLTFSQTLGGSAPAPQTLAVSAAGGSVTFTATAATTTGGNWLSVSPSNGTTPSSLTVSVNATGLTAAAYTGSITIVSAGAGNSPQIVPVTLTVGTAISITPSSLAFSYQNGTPLPAAQPIAVAAGTAALSFTATATTTTGGGWLTVLPPLGTTPANLSVSVNPIGLSAGSYTGTVSVAAAGAINSPQTVNVTLTIAAAPPPPAVAAVVNAATFLPTAVSPGQIVTMFGTGIGPATAASLRLTASGQVDTVLSDTRVLFDGLAAPMIFASSTQASAVVPYAVFGRFSTRLQIEFQGVRSNPVDLRVVDAAPGIFTLSSSGSGQGAILNQNFSVNGANNAAAKDSVVMIYATGEGQTNPSGVDGAVTGNVLRRPMQPVSVTIGGQAAEVLYAGASPGLVSGVLQVNARVPATVASGSAVPVVLIIGGGSSQTGVTMAVQ